MLRIVIFILTCLFILAYTPAQANNNQNSNRILIIKCKVVSIGDIVTSHNPEFVELECDDMSWQYEIGDTVKMYVRKVRIRPSISKDDNRP